MKTEEARVQGGITEQCEEAATAACERYALQMVAPEDRGHPLGYSFQVLQDDAGGIIVTSMWIVAPEACAAELAAELRACGMKTDVDVEVDGWDKRLLEQVANDGWVTIIRNKDGEATEVKAAPPQRQ
jgi:L-2-hydroxyglutarate oxidase LhgO